MQTEIHMTLNEYANRALRLDRHALHRNILIIIIMVGWYMKPTNKKNKKKEEFERRKKKVFNYLKDHVDYCRVYLNGQLCGVCVCVGLSWWYAG